MVVFEWIIALLVGSVVLSAFARRLSIPYPTLLAVGGAVLAVSHAPPVALDPELALALFVAPVLLDTAFDTSLRDLRENWVPISGLVLAAVGFTTVAVAFVVRHFVPEMPWAAAIALGAIVAPPDAAAAVAVLRQLRPPYRLLMILEGESLLNDASALLIYRVAVGAATAGAFSFSSAAPVFLIGVVGSVLVAPVLAYVIMQTNKRITDVPSAIIMQFCGAFGVWIIAEHLHLSGVLTIVVMAMVVSRLAEKMPARQRVPSFAVWETTVFVLNVMAFVFVGLQVAPIIQRIDQSTLRTYLMIAGAVLAAVILARLAWTFAYGMVVRFVGRRRQWKELPSAKNGFVIGWCGMRGIVTLAGALALPEEFPHRDLVLFCAFSVVLGTLVIQGLTLPIFLRVFDVHDDDPVGREIHQGRRAAYQAALKALDADTSESARAVRSEIEDVIKRTEQVLDGGHEDLGPSIAKLRQKAGEAAREALFALRRNNTIGDVAYHKLEEELDWAELATESKAELGAET